MTRQCEQCELQRVSPRILKCKRCGHIEPYKEAQSEVRR